MENHHIDVDGIRMRWIERGAGRPTIFVHGIPTSPEVWRHVLPRIEGARCLAWEMVGFGESIPEGRDRDIALHAQADYLIAWMDAIGLERAALVGHDLGGGVSQIAAVRHPDRFEGIVLSNAVCYDEWPVWPVDMARKLSPLVDRSPDFALRPAFKLLVEHLHTDPEMAQEAFELHWSRYAEHDAGEAFARQVDHLDSSDTEAISDDLPKLGKPARLVWGAADPYLTIDVGRRLAQDLGATIDCVEEGNHFLLEDHADRVAQTVNALLRDLD